MALSFLKIVNKCDADCSEEGNSLTKMDKEPEYTKAVDLFPSQLRHFNGSNSSFSTFVTVLSSRSINGLL
jgi:hypothetical protein